MLRQKTLQSPKLLRRKRKQRILICAALIFAAGILGYGLSALSHLQSLRIREITVNGTSVLPAPEIISRIEEWISGSKGLIFAADNVALVRTGALESAVRAAFPRVKEVSVDRTSLTGMRVDIEEREAAALFCEPGPLEGDLICAYMDEGGTVFAMAPDFSPEVFVQYEDGRTKESVSVRLEERIPFTPFDKKTFAELAKFAESVSNLGIQSRIIKVKDLGEFDLIVRARDGMQGRVSWNDLQPFTQTFANLELFIRDTLKGASFEYIDLRFGNNIFYKAYGETK